MQKWQRLDDGSDVVKVGFRTVVRKKFRLNDGKTMTADVTSPEGNAAAGIIALTQDGKVVIARQFRCGPEEIMDEIPGGLVDPGETPEQAAKRELIEEAGFEAGEVEYLGKAHVNAWDNMVHHYFLAKNCFRVSSNNPEEYEEIEVDQIPIAQFIDNAMHARMTDVQAVLLAYDKLKELEGVSS